MVALQRQRQARDPRRELGSRHATEQPRAIHGRYLVAISRSVSTTTEAGSAGAAWHLWASLKQNASGTHDPALEQEGSSAVANTWLQSHPVDFTCDGHRHVQRFTIDTVEQGFGQAVRGEGWVQFCLIDFADASNQRAAIVQEWRSVR